MYAFEIKEKYGRFVKDGKRLGRVLFVVQNGKFGEMILGLVTAWDLGKTRQWIWY